MEPLQQCKPQPLAHLLMMFCSVSIHAAVYADWLLKYQTHANLLPPTCKMHPLGVQKLQGLNLGWVNNYLTTNNISAASTNGKYLQLKSDFPGQGPCYPVWVETNSFFHR